MLAFLIGRKTRKTYRQPLSYFRDGGTLLTPGGGNWKLNLVKDVPVRIRLAGKDVMASPEVVADVSEIGRLLSVILAANPRAAAFIGISRGPDGSFYQAAVENAVRYGFRIVRWHVHNVAA